MSIQNTCLEGKGLTGLWTLPYKLYQHLDSSSFNADVSTQIVLRKVIDSVSPQGEMSSLFLCGVTIFAFIFCLSKYHFSTHILILEPVHNSLPHS